MDESICWTPDYITTFDLIRLFCNFHNRSRHLAATLSDSTLSVIKTKPKRLAVDILSLSILRPKAISQNFHLQASESNYSFSFPLLLPAFQQVFQDQAHSRQGPEAEPPHSPVDPYENWQHHQVSHSSCLLSHMNSFLDTLLILLPFLIIAGTPSVATGDAPSSTSKYLSITVTKISGVLISFLQIFTV